MTRRTRVLLAITVYNGEAFVPQTLESASRLDAEGIELDVLILDDASPSPGWSERLATLCADLGIEYYCSPRNLGIPRNVSLGLLAAVQRGYDHVIVSNSDVIYPRMLVPRMLEVVAHPGVGSVTAWSNNCSMYSLPNEDPNALLADQSVVDRVSDALWVHYGDAAMDIPAGISFCMMIPTSVISDVGVMDPVFGRGYCEETDWSLRSLAAGYRIALAPGVFVFHAGRGSSLEAGLLSDHHTSVPENEDVIDLRYPMFRSQVGAFSSSGVLQEAQTYGIVAVLRQAGKDLGYVIETGWLTPDRSSDRVVCTIAPDGLDETVRLEYRGFRYQMDVDPFRLGPALGEFFGGRSPSRVVLRERGAVSTSLLDVFPALAARVGSYPARV